MAALFGTGQARFASACARKELWMICAVIPSAARQVETRELFVMSPSKMLVTKVELKWYAILFRGLDVHLTKKMRMMSLTWHLRLSPGRRMSANGEVRVADRMWQRTAVHLSPRLETLATNPDQQMSPTLHIWRARKAMLRTEG